MAIILLIILITSEAANATQDNQLDSAPSNFQPSLFIVIGVLSFMFSLTLLLLVFAKWCHREPSAIHNLPQENNIRGMFGADTRFSGLDKTVVESLPFFRFSTLKGAKEGLQCAVCLAEFEEIEILRLLPKCKHGFHIECIDQWLENHSTCPLCRQKISAEDLTNLINSSSMRFIIGGKSDAGEASSNFELFVERGDDQKSSRFSIGGSFRRFMNANKEEEMLIQVQQQGNFHRLNHQIVVSDVVFKNRWSDLSSSDLMFLNSEMLGVMSSNRISSDRKYFTTCHEGNDDHYNIMNIKDEIDRKRMFEHRVGQIKKSCSNSSLKAEMGFDESRQFNLSPPRTSSMMAADKRAMSEITAMSRFKDLNSMKNKLRQCLEDTATFNDSVRDDITRRRKWFPIARRTVQWFANREKNRSQQQNNQSVSSGQILNV